MKMSHSYAGFNLAGGSDVKLFDVVLDGDNVMQGFRNANIQEALYGTTADPLKRCSQTAAVCCLLMRLYVADSSGKCRAAEGGTLF